LSLSLWGGQDLISKNNYHVVCTTIAYMNAKQESFFNRVFSLHGGRVSWQSLLTWATLIMELSTKWSFNKERQQRRQKEFYREWENFKAQTLKWVCIFCVREPHGSLFDSLLSKTSNEPIQLSPLLFSSLL